MKRMMLAVLLLSACTQSPDEGAPPVASTELAATSTTQTVNAKVINTDAESVPMHAVGTTAVSGTVAAQQSGPWSVGVSGPVGAAQSGAWSVDVAALPPVSLADDTQVVARFAEPQEVNIANTPSVNANVTGGNVAVTGTVTVANAALPVATPAGGSLTVRTGSGSPLAMKDADAAGIGATTSWLDPPTSSGADHLLYTVPSGKVLVVEYLSFDTFGKSGDFVTALLSGTINGGPYAAAFRFQPTPTGGNFPLYVYSGQTRLYFSAGPVNISIPHTLDGVTTWTANVAIAGRLVDAP